MFKSIVALAIVSAASAPVLAQSAPAPAQPQQQYQIVKKKVCTKLDVDETGSRLSAVKSCRIVEEKVPVTTNGQAQAGGTVKANASPE